ncbi:MAG: flagellar biosynthetic protein FliO [Bryobacteraceae bacterium]|nr:flagellar biosynthetic protein FliO [Bryobacteraceae bacterium]
MPEIGDILQLVLALAVTLGVIWFSLRYVLPRLRVGQPGLEGLVRVRAVCPLEPGKSLYLVQAGTQTLLVGAAPQSLEMIAVLPPGSVPDESTEPRPEPPSFRDLLTRRRP